MRLVAAGAVLALLPLAGAGRAEAPSWATAWTTTTTNGTSQVNVGALYSYTNTVKNEAGLANYWRMGDASGNLTAAYGGVAAGPTGGPTYGLTGAITGDSNTAIGFNGGQNFDAGNLNWFNNNSPYTLEIWFKTPSSLSNGTKRIVDKMDVSGTINGWDLGFNGADSGNAWQPYCGRSANNTTVVAGPGVALSASTWYYLVCTYDGSNLKFYLDGVLKDTKSATGSMGTTTHNISIGSLNGSSSYLTGTLDEFAIYGVALSATAIATHYSAASAGIP